MMLVAFKHLWIASTLALWASFGLAQEARERVIIVQGVGEVSAVPDVTQVQLGVVISDPNARTALSEVARAMNRTISTLQDAGVAEADIQTTTLMLNPLYDNSRLTGERAPPRSVAFEARTGLTVTLRAGIETGSVLDDLVRAGSNEINGISFEVDAPEPLLDQARAAAVRDARRKATLMVDAAGETLGPLMEIREAGVSAPPMPFARAETAMMSDMPIARGATDLTARVTLVFALSD